MPLLAAVDAATLLRFRYSLPLLTLPLPLIRATLPPLPDYFACLLHASLSMLMLCPPFRHAHFVAYTPLMLILLLFYICHALFCLFFFFYHSPLMFSPFYIL